MRAAEQNDVDAQYSVGTFFLHGEGTQRDVPESIRWFQKASKQGHHDASCMLAKLTAVPGTPPPDKGQCSDLRNPSETHEQRKQRVLEAANASDEEVRFATNYQTILGALMNGSYHKATTGNLDEALDMHIYLELFATALGRQVTPIDSPKNARPWQMLKTPSGLITYGDFASRVARRRRAIMAQIADILINEYHDPNSAMVIQNSQEGKHNQAYRSGMEKIAILLERNDFRQDAEDLRNVKNTIQLPEPPGRWTVLS